MRRFSRWMSPAAHISWGLKTKVVLIILVLAIIMSILLWQSARFVAFFVVAIMLFSWWRSNLHMKRVAASRPGEDIGSFAKAFDRHQPDFDPYVIRAVWDALQQYRTFHRGIAPLRPTDRLESFMDLEDLDLVVIPEVAARTGRTLESAAANPRYGHVETVVDIVEFFWKQPLRQ